MRKRIKWTKMHTCLLAVSVAFAVVLTLAWRKALSPVAQPWEITAQKGDLQPEEVHGVDLNTADGETLRLLPGIGEVLSQRIIAYREARGGFTAVEELLNVKGIGEAILGDIADYIELEVHHENTCCR